MNGHSTYSKIPQKKNPFIAFNSGWKKPWVKRWTDKQINHSML